MKKLLLVLLQIILVYEMNSQNYSVKKYTIDDGLLLNQTGTVFQDERGYLWISYLTGNWQLFDDKKFVTVPCKGSFGFDFQASGHTVYTSAHYGHFVINNYVPRFFPMDTNLYETASGFGYSNLNKRAFNSKGDLYILKLNTGKPEQEVTSIDTIYKKNNEKISYLLCDFHKHDTAVKFSFEGRDGNNIWIAAHHARTYHCIGLYKIEEDKVIKVNFNPPGEVSAIYNEKGGKTWILWQSPDTQKYFVSLLEKNIKTKEYELGLLESVGTRLQSDKKGNLWLPYLKGLIRINPSKSTVEYFEDKKREILIEYGHFYTFGVYSPSLKDCDRNYYKIAITSKNEVVCGNKIFSPEKGFVDLIDKELLGAGSLKSCMVDAEDNIWFSGNGLIKLTPVPISKLEMPADFKLLYVSPSGNSFGFYINNKINKSVVLASDINGTRIDSFAVEPIQDQTLDFFNAKGATILCFLKSMHTKEFVNFDGKRFQKINSAACNFKCHQTEVSLVFSGQDSAMMYLRANRVFSLQGLTLVEITKKLNTELRIRGPKLCGYSRPVYSYFEGFTDSTGVYIYKNYHFDFTPFVGSDFNDRNDYAGFDYLIPNKKNALLFIFNKKRKVYCFDGSAIKAVQCKPEEIDKFTYEYIKISFWINDSIFIAANEKRLSRWTLSTNFSNVRIEEMVSVAAQEDVSGEYFLANKIVFYRPFLQDIKYFASEDLKSGKLFIRTIPNTAIKGTFFTNELFYFDRLRRTFYYKDGTKTSYINFTNFASNQREAKLSIIDLKWTVGDSIYKTTEENSDLPYNFNPLKISYKGICLTDGKKVRYRYFLNGLDNEWQETEEDFVNYSTLPPGSYQFSITACNNDGIWNKIPASISFTIKPPIYRTLGAYFIYVLFGVSTIMLFIRFRTRALKKERDNLENLVLQRTAEILNQKHIIEEKQNEILDSINYAQRIQRALLASEALLNKNLNDYFVLFRPKDVVSGDFYWASNLENGQFALVIADSTGHGVPGAIMSMLNIACLNEAVESHELCEPKDIIGNVRGNVIRKLANDGSEGGGKDGMDCSMVVFDYAANCIKFSGAYNPLWLVRNGELIEIDADKMPVGRHDKDQIPFTQKTVAVYKGDMIYALTDGFPDQFGGPKGKKFMYKQMKEKLIEVSSLETAEQKMALEKTLSDWIGELEQVDDITVVGIRI